MLPATLDSHYRRAAHKALSLSALSGCIVCLLGLWGRSLAQAVDALGWIQGAHHRQIPHRDPRRRQEIPRLDSRRRREIPHLDPRRRREIHRLDPRRFREIPHHQSLRHRQEAVAEAWGKMKVSYSYHRPPCADLR